MSATAHAVLIPGLSVGNPDGDGEYRVNLPSNVWDPFGSFLIDPGTLEETYTSTTGTEVNTYSIPQGTTYYQFEGKADGEYSYFFRASGRWGQNTGGEVTTNTVTTTVMNTASPTSITPETPTENTTGEVHLVWQISSGSTFYELNERVSGGAWEKIISPLGNSETVTRANGVYEYTVVACNLVGCSLPSPVHTVTVSKTPNTPNFIVPLSATPGNVSLGWTNSTASYYELYFDEAGQPLDSGLIYSGANQSHTTSLMAGNYRFRVRACNLVDSLRSCSTWGHSEQLAVRFTEQSYQSDKYDVYVGDVNGDGILDYTLVGKQQFVLIHGSISIPILLPREESYVYYGLGGGVFDEVEQWQFEENVLSNFDLIPVVSSTIVVSNDSIANIIAPIESRYNVAPEFEYDLNETIDVDFGTGEFVAITKGHEGVANGHATYSVPIVLPPSVNGLAPKLALNYNSGFKGTSSMGVGWNMTGLSVITRCRATYATEQDRAKESRPKYSDSDRLCLNGQKLILTDGPVDASDSQYWASGATYKTERDAFLKVVAENSHDSFTAYLKNGDIAYFGSDEASASSKAYRPGDYNGVVKAWGVDNVENRYGNSYQVHYSHDSTTFEFYPSEILLEPGARVVFDYTDRSVGNRKLYDAGSSWKVSKKLESVTTYIDSTLSSVGGGDTMVYKYKIKYQSSAASNDLLVEEIQQCGNNNGVDQCAEPLVFDWDAGDSGFEVANRPLQTCGSGTVIDGSIVLDINNDGYNDVIDTVITTTSLGTLKDWFLFLGTSEGCFDTTSGFNHNLLSWGIQNLRPIMLHDGLALLVSRRVSNYQSGSIDISEYEIGIVKTDFDPAGMSIARIDLVEVRNYESNYDGRVEVGDFNGDGLQDLWFTGSVYFQNETGGFSKQDDGNYVSSIQHNAGLYPVDWNGDGLGDLLMTYNADDLRFALPDYDVHSDTSSIWLIENFAGSANGRANPVGSFLSSDTSTFWGGPISHGTLQLVNQLLWKDYAAPVFNGFGDLNGDGIKDIVFHRNDTWKVKLGTGIGFATAIETGIATVSRDNHYFFVKDHNGDGLDDLYVQYASSGSTEWKILLSKFDAAGDLQFDEILEDPFMGHSPLTGVENAVEAGGVFRGDLDNDGIADFYRSGRIAMGGLHSINSRAAVYHGKTNFVNTLRSVTNGFGRQVAFEYSTLSNDLNNGEPVYTPGENGDDYLYPYARPKRSMQVVKKISTSNGIDGTFDTYFNYYGGKQHLTGRGFLGFDRITQTNVTKGKKIVSEFLLDWPFTGLIKKKTESDAGGTLIAELETDYVTHSENTEFVYAEKTTRKEYHLQGTLLSATLIESQYDQYGGLHKQKVTRGNGISSDGEITGTRGSSLTINTIHNNVTDWLLGFIEQVDSAVTSSAIAGWTLPAESDDTRIIKTVLTAESNTLDVAVKREYADTYLELKTTYVRDQARGAKPGVLTQVKTQAKNSEGNWLTERSATFGDFQKGIFARSRKNALNHESTYTYNLSFGLADWVRDPNSQELTTVFDSFGRARQSTDALNAVSDMYQYYCSNVNGPLSCPANGVYYTITKLTHTESGEKLGQPAVASFYDLLGRELRVDEFSVGGEVVKVSTEYTPQGYLSRISEPYKASEAEYFTTYSNFNVLGEALSVVEPDGTEVSIAYSVEGGLLKRAVTQSISDSNSVVGETRSTYTNALSEVAKAEDDHGTPIEYTYDPLGNLASTIVNGNNDTKVTLTHDIAGNNIYMDDPASGKIEFTYNGYGELEKQTWEKGTTNQKSLSYSYDVLGRQTARTDKRNSLVEASYGWVFDTRKLGLLTRVTGEGYTEEYTYTGNVQLDTVSTTIPGSSAKLFSYTYDNFGRLESKLFPSGLRVEQHYSGYGYHAETVDLTTHDTSEVIWRLANVLDDRGAFTHQRYGNGVVTANEFDVRNGNLINTRTGYALGASLDVDVANIQNLSYEWDSIGNLQNRSSGRESASGISLENIVEEFEYDSLHRLKNSKTTWSQLMPRSIDYDYDVYGNLTLNHTGVVEYNQVNGASVYGVTKASGQNYYYDVYGNVRAKGAQVLEYDVFNKPTRMGNTNFVYGPDHEKLKQIDGDTVTYYFDGGSYEEVVKNGTTTQRSNVSGFYVHESMGSVDKVQYLHFDHLGSVEAITDINGSFSARMRFDAFGNRLNSDWSTDISIDLPVDIMDLTWGFTGHDMIDQEGLIHMGGRVYDPDAGRFMSADVYVQAPYNTQSYNRYSYVFNNPLSLVDPTGYATVCTSAGKDASGREIRECTTINDDPDISDAERQAAKDNANNDFTLGDATQLAAEAFIPGASTVAALMEGDYKGAVVEAGFELLGVAAGLFTGGTGYVLVKTLKAGRVIKKTKKALSTKKAKGKGKCCFIAGTLVLTLNGHANIEDIEVGDLVWSKDPVTGEQAYKPVTELIRKHDRQIYQLVVSTKSGEDILISTTHDHPFYVPELGWKSPVELVVGDVIETHGHGVVSVKSVATDGSVQPTYNFTVADFHTYYVTDRNLLVHNEECDVAKGADSKLSRNGAFKEAKQKAGVPRSQQPDKVYKEKIRDQQGHVEGRVYEFKGKDGSTTTIREHSLGHKLDNHGPHFNSEVRSSTGIKQPLGGNGDSHTYFN